MLLRNTLCFGIKFFSHFYPPCVFEKVNAYDTFLVNLHLPSFLYSRAIRFSFLHSTYCPLMQYGLCRNWNILTVVSITIRAYRLKKFSSYLFFWQCCFFEYHSSTVKKIFQLLYFLTQLVKFSFVTSIKSVIVQPQCHLLKQISVKNQESAFSYP